MKVLNSGDIIHSSMFFDTPFPGGKKEQNQNHGHGFTYTLNIFVFSDLMFRIGSDIVFKVIDDHKTPSSIDCWALGVTGDQCTLYTQLLITASVSFFEREFIMPIGDS